MFRRLNTQNAALLRAAALRSYRPVDQSGNSLGQGGSAGAGPSSQFGYQGPAFSRGGGAPQQQFYSQQQQQQPTVAPASNSGSDEGFGGGWTDLSDAAAPLPTSHSPPGHYQQQQGSPASSSSGHFHQSQQAQLQQQHTRGGYGGPQHHQQFQQHRGGGGGYGRGGPPGHQQQQQQGYSRGGGGGPNYGRGGGGGGYLNRGGFQQGHQQHSPGAPSAGLGASPHSNTASSFRGGPAPPQQQQQQSNAAAGAEEDMGDVVEADEDEVEGDEELVDADEEEAVTVMNVSDVSQLKISVKDHLGNVVKVQPLKNFEHLDEDIPRWLLEGLRSTGYKQPMPVQATSIPLLMEGRDVIAVAPTGSGKTVAFAIPALGNISTRDAVRGRNRASPAVVVMCPTRELVQQTHKVLMALCGRGGPMIQAVYGGTDRETQANIVRRGAEVIVATPGRLCDFLEDDVISLERLDFLVLDEADRMLEMGFAPQLSMITSCLNKSRPRVTMMWSATWSDVVSGLAKNFLNPNRLLINCEGDGNTANKNITQKVYAVRDESEKLRAIVSLYSSGAISMDQKTIIFAKRKDDIQELTTQVARALGYPMERVAGLHGSLRQTKRAGIIRSFREGKVVVLVATDIAGRGLDVPGIDHVINMDLPLHIDSYVHRIGRTGRAGRKGTAHTLISTRDSSAVVAQLGEYYTHNSIDTPLELKAVFKHAHNRSLNRKEKVRYKDHSKIQAEFWRTKGHDPNAPKPSFHRGGGGGGGHGGGGAPFNKGPRIVGRS